MLANSQPQSEVMHLKIITIMVYKKKKDYYHYATTTIPCYSWTQKVCVENQKLVETKRFFLFFYFFIFLFFIFIERLIKSNLKKLTLIWNIITTWIRGPSLAPLGTRDCITCGIYWNDWKSCFLH